VHTNATRSIRAESVGALANVRNGLTVENVAEAIADHFAEQSPVGFLLTPEFPKLTLD
jgi:hypothetical protein